MFDLDGFVVECRTALAEAQPMVAVREIVARAVSDPSAIAPALPDSGITVMVQEPDLTVLCVVIPGGLPKSGSIMPHDHRMWAVVGIYGGQEDNQFFRRDARSLVESGGRSLRVSDTLAMGDGTIHAIRNPLDHSALAAIHVYGGDLLGAARSMWVGPDYTEQPYDESTVIGGRGFRRANRDAG
jgi:predicted metal-dependent enzyme (double-stranded beta helix superfamily)